MRHVFIIASFFIAFIAHAGDQSARESARIEFLIQSVATLQNAQFLRNGSAYGAAEAADHLRLKFKKAGSAVKSAEDFIHYCATESSTSGKAYEIKFSDGRVVPSATFLKQKLAEYDAQH